MDICVDQIFLTYILDFVSKFTARLQPLLSTNKMEQIWEGEHVDIHHIYNEEQEISQKLIYFEHFIINSGKATVSFTTAVRRSYDMYVRFFF